MDITGKVNIIPQILNGLFEPAVICHSGSKNIIHWNLAFENLALSFGVKTPSHKSLNKFLGDTSFEPILKVTSKLKEDKTESLQLNPVNSQGIAASIECRISFLGQIEKKELHLLIFKDLSPQKKIEEHLLSAQTKYERVVNNMDEFIVHWKKDGVRTFVNKSYCKYYNTTEKESLGSSFFPLISKEDLSNVRQRIKGLTPEKPETEGEHRVIRPDGSLGWNYWRDKAIFKNGEVIEYHSIGRDITDKKAAELKLIQAEKMEVMGQLAGGIAHDFNNQLSGFQAYAELIKIKGQKDKETAVYADKILTLVQRSKELTRQLLTFSRQEESQNQIFDIHSILEEVNSILERSIDKRIELILNLNSSNSHLLGNASQMQNAILNLALNARDAISNKGEIEFTTTDKEVRSGDLLNRKYHIPSGNFIEISIKDNGIGMDEKVKEKIFEPFFTTKETGKGTGMGLAAVYTALKHHHGHIDVKSQPNQGTEFLIYLPVARKPKIKKIKPDKSAHRITKANILFVDDEEMLATSVQLILSSFGFKVFTAKSGLEAIQFYSENSKSIDLVLLDMNMPKMDGRETLLELKKIRPDIKALMLSGYSQDQAAAEEELGIRGFIQKPFTEDDLTEKIAKILG